MISRLAKAAVLAGSFALQGDWTPARPDYRWSFPRDHWAHPSYRTEWWYFTGQLQAADDTARRFGYQFTIFRVGFLRRQPVLNSDWVAQMLVMGHAAITDLGSGEHHFSETLYRAIPLLGGFGEPGDSLVAFSRGPAGTEDRWTLRWTGGGFDFAMADRRQDLAFDLRTTPARPLALEGPNGFSRKGDGPEAASLYYSYTRLATSGSLRSGGRDFRVQGTSWMDEEFGSNQLGPGQAGWDWFSLQLDDGRDLMLYLLRDTTGTTDHAGGTVVPGSGSPHYLAADAFTVRPLAQWTSAETRATYPARWAIEVPGEALRLEVVPLLADQENRSRLVRGLYYWEGAVTVRDAAGRSVGRGYVELVGYGKGLRPAI
jgi:predicted secreted hydrolase